MTAWHRPGQGSRAGWRSTSYSRRVVLEGNGNLARVGDSEEAGLLVVLLGGFGLVGFDGTLARGGFVDCCMGKLGGTPFPCEGSVGL